MLIVTRRVGERIMIGHEIIIAVISIDGMQVRIGVETPRTLEVYREEVYLKKQADRGPRS